MNRSGEKRRQNVSESEDYNPRLLIMYHFSCIFVQCGGSHRKHAFHDMCIVGIIDNVDELVKIAVDKLVDYLTKWFITLLYIA